MSSGRPFLICAFALCGAAACAVLPARAQDRPPLMIGTWGGAYEDAQRAVLLDPFTSRTGQVLKTVALSDPLATLRAAAAGGANLQIADLPDAEADAACAEHLLEPLDVAFFDRGSGGSDFLMPPTPCGIPSTLISEVVVYNHTVLAAKTPARAADIFDIVNFPGKRALKRDAMGTFEWALMADGVAPGEIYNVLATPAGVDRAFAKLDAIRDHVQWWDRGDVPLTALARGEVVMAAAYSPWAYQAIVGQSLPFTIVWPGALVSANRWVLVKGQGGNAAAREFIKFATDTARLAEFARATPYGPARKSAIDMLVPEMHDYAPSTPEHWASALPVNAAFWRDYGGALRQRFEVWLMSAAAQAQAAAPSTDQAARKE